MKDRSSYHPSVNYHLLDWSAVLDPVTFSPLMRLLRDQINADLIVGADIVGWFLPHPIIHWSAEETR
jgi:hypothetical protein